MHIFNHRKISSRQRQDSFFRRIGDDPYVDWLIMLVVVVVLVGVSAFFGYRTYVGVQSRLSEPTVHDASGNPSAFDVGALSGALKEFNDRTAGRAGILQGSGMPGDPSL